MPKNLALISFLNKLFVEREYLLRQGTVFFLKQNHHLQQINEVENRKFSEQLKDPGLNYLLSLPEIERNLDSIWNFEVIPKVTGVIKLILRIESGFVSKENKVLSKLKTYEYPVIVR